MGVRRALFVTIPVEGNEIVGQEFVERINAAAELPPHHAQGNQDRNEEGKFCPVHVSAIAGSRLVCHIVSIVRPARADRSSPIQYPPFLAHFINNEVL